MSYTTKSWEETIRDLRQCMDKYPGLINNWRLERLVQGKRKVYLERTTDDGVFQQDASTPPYNFRQVTLFYELRDRTPAPMSCTKYPTARENLRVLYLCIDALRLIAARGLDALVRTHYAQLPPPATTPDPYQVLGVRRDLPPPEIEQVFRAQVQRYHEAGFEPNAARLRDITLAIAAIRKEHA